MTHRLRMIRACAPSLADGRLTTTYRDLVGCTVGALGGTNRCPMHDEALPLRYTAPPGACLDNFWSQRHLASRGWLDMFRLWRSWRKAAQR